MSGSLAVLQTTKAVVPGSNPASLSMEPSPTNSSCINLPQGWAADPCPPPCPAPPCNYGSKSTQTYLKGGQPDLVYHPSNSSCTCCLNVHTQTYLKGGQPILAHHPVQLLVYLGLNLNRQLYFLICSLFTITK